MASGIWSPLAIGVADGPTLTAAAAASCLPDTGRFTFSPNSITQGSTLRVQAHGRISCVVTTPGTARYDLRLGATVIFDSGAMSLNATAKTTVPFWLEINVTCRTAGSAGTFMGFSKFITSAIIGSPAATAGGNGVLISSVSGGPASAPAVGNTVDLTANNTLDCFFTQTVATGSMTIHSYVLESGAILLM